MKSTTTIIIVNYRTADLVLDCLSSLAEEVVALPGTHVVVVDNASGDSSVPEMRSAIGANGWEQWITLIASPRNGGFSAGNNLAIRSRLSNFYLLLNPDTIVRPGAVFELLEFMRERPRAGIAGSHLEARDGKPLGSARRCPSPISELDAGARTGPVSRLLARWVVPLHVPYDDGPVACDWVSGAAMFVRREVFEEIGLLDEGYFLYFEELDLCERARRAGWEVWTVPQSRVVHLEGGSTKGRGARRPSCWYDSRRRFFLKRHGVVGLVCADALWCVGRAMYTARRAFGLAGRAVAAPTDVAGQLLWGDAKAIASGRAFRIARGT